MKVRHRTTVGFGERLATLHGGVGSPRKSWPKRLGCPAA